MEIYHYDPVSGAFIGAGQADASPLEPGVWLIPAHATTIAPPSNDTRFVRVFRDGKWSFIAPEEPEAPEVEEPEDFVPSAISRRQFFQQLALSGLITTDEALAAAQRTALPAAFTVFIDTLDPLAKFSAQMALFDANAFEREHPLVSAFAQVQGLYSEQIDNLWKAAGQL